MSGSADWPQYISLGLAGLGAAVAMAGTLSMAHSYHVFSHPHFVRYALRNVFRMCTRAGRQKVMEDTDRLAAAADFTRRTGPDP